MATPLSHRHLTVKCRAYVDFAKGHSFFSLTNEQYEIKGTVALHLGILNLRYSNYCLIIYFISFNLLEMFTTRMEGLRHFLVTLFFLSSCLAMTTLRPLFPHRYFLEDVRQFAHALALHRLDQECLHTFKTM